MEISFDDGKTWHNGEDATKALKESITEETKESTHFQMAKSDLEILIEATEHLKNSNLIRYRQCQDVFNKYITRE